MCENIEGEDIIEILKRKDKSIDDLINERDAFKNKLEKIEKERDNLLCEVNKLKFELQMSDLKRLGLPDDKIDVSLRGSFDINGGYINSSLFRSAAKLDRHFVSGCSARNVNGVPPLSGGAALGKSYNLELAAAASQLQQHKKTLLPLYQRTKPISHSSGIGKRNLLTRAHAVDDSLGHGEHWSRRNGGASSGQSYELSQDLAEKRLEMLERRYGGERARSAATTIQRAYRQYAMHKKFQAIRATAKGHEKRLSKRFTIDIPTWSGEAGGHCAPDPEQVISREFDQLNRNLSVSVYGDSRKPSRSLSMRDPGKGGHRHHPPRDANALELCNGYAVPSKHSLRSDHGKVCPLSSSETSSAMVSASGVATSKRGSQKGSGKRVPPEVPRRTSSVKSTDSGNTSDGSGSNSSKVHSTQQSFLHPSSPMTSDSPLVEKDSLKRSADNGSLSSVQSSGSDSSISLSASDRTTPSLTETSDIQLPTSPVWKRKSQGPSAELVGEEKRLSNISENSEDSCHSHSSEGLSYSNSIPSSGGAERYINSNSFLSGTKVSEVVRKRQYRVGLNLFNKKPEKGITYLVQRGFLEDSPAAVAKFLLARKGLSKQMIGEYLGNLQNAFSMSVLECFAQEVDLCGMQVDVALRKFQSQFHLPGEAQKIEHLMQVFGRRYCQSNRDIVAKLRDPDTIFVLAFAIVMLNTDLHSTSLKPEKKMKLEDFVKNLRGIDDGCDIDREMLEGMYHRIKSQEFRPGHDHVIQVMKVQQTIVGKKPNLCLPHRRLVCYCRLFEVPDISKKERIGLHQREVFLFNDLLVITKIFSKKKNAITYTFRESFPLAGLMVCTKETPHYPYTLEIRQRVDAMLLITFNARNEHDRSKFCEDLKESICEMDEMESLRIEGELERQKASLRAAKPSMTSKNRDSGVADMELLPPEKNGHVRQDGGLKRSALSNSLINMHEAGGELLHRLRAHRGSLSSLEAVGLFQLRRISLSSESLASGFLGHFVRRKNAAGRQWTSSAAPPN